jgi:hypothetical protein
VIATNALIITKWNKSILFNYLVYIISFEKEGDLNVRTVNSV